MLFFKRNSLNVSTQEPFSLDDDDDIKIAYNFQRRFKLLSMIHSNMSQENEKNYVNTLYTYVL
jgi:hypothetical protein